MNSDGARQTAAREVRLRRTATETLRRAATNALRRSKTTKSLLTAAAALVAFVSLFGVTARASSGDEGPVHGLAPFVLLSIALMLLVAKLGGELFAKFGQPAVLGELVGGILLGSLSLF